MAEVLWKHTCCCAFMQTLPVRKDGFSRSVREKQSRAKERIVDSRADKKKHTQERSKHVFTLEFELMFACHVTDGGLAGNPDNDPRIWKGNSQVSIPEESFPWRAASSHQSSENRTRKQLWDTGCHCHPMRGHENQNKPEHPDTYPLSWVWSHGLSSLLAAGRLVGVLRRVVPGTKFIWRCR